MSELVDDCVPDFADCVAAITGVAQNGSAEDYDLVGQRRMHAKDAEEIVGVIVEEIEILVGWFFFDDDGDIFEKRRETLRQLVERLPDELLEFVRRDHQPGMILNPKTQPAPGRWNGFA